MTMIFVRCASSKSDNMRMFCDIEALGASAIKTVPRCWTRVEMVRFMFSECNFGFTGAIRDAVHAV